MNIFQISMLLGAAITALISIKLPHAFMWICLAGANAVVCDLFYAYDLPYPAAFTLACDCLLCLSIHWLAEERWEIGLYVIFAVSVSISLLHMWVLADAYLYRMLLEICNWAALLLISGTAIVGRVGSSDHFLHRSRRHYVADALASLRRPRKTPHWSKNY